MEDLDISNKLRGFDPNLNVSLHQYLKMLKSTDIETLYLTIGMIYNDSIFLKYMNHRLGNHDYILFKYYLESILDENVSESRRYLFIVSVIRMLSRLLNLNVRILNGIK